MKNTKTKIKNTNKNANKYKQQWQTKRDNCFFRNEQIKIELNNEHKTEQN